MARLDRAAGDVAEPATWRDLPGASTLVHLAARSFVPASWTEPAAYLRTNTLGTSQALEYCRTRGARLVFVSSYMYGAPRRLPVDEAAPLEARNPYALSKRLAEELCQFYAASFGVGVSVLRLFNVYGPGQREPFLIPYLQRQIEEGREVRVKDLEPRRDYVHVEDVVDAIIRTERLPGGFHVFNIGSGVSHSVAEIIAMMQEVRGTKLPVISEQSRRKDEIMDAVADITAARAALSWAPSHSLRAGLEDILAEHGGDA